MPAGCARRLHCTLQLGYQHKGFPEAQVAVRPDVPAGIVRVKVTEGPRYLCGGVKVIGAQRMPVRAIVERLTDQPEAAALAQTAFRFMDQGPSSHALEEAGGNKPVETKAFWAKGNPILASEVDLRDLKTVVINTMREHGLLSPRINVSVEPDKATQTAELRVEVIEEGPSGVIDRVEVTGTRKNKPEAVVRYLDVPPGTPLTGEVITWIEADTAGLPDAYDTNAPLSSAVAFLVEEAVQSRLLKSLLHARKVSEGSSRLPAMLRRLNLTNILSPLNQLLPPTLADARGETGFWIPEEPGAVPGSGNLMVDMVGSWLLRHSDQLFEAGSWARALLREAALVVQRQGSYTEQVLAEVYESSETGPLGFWVAASLVGRAGSPWRQKFAARGLERLSAEHFRRDCRLLLTGRSVLSQCFEELAATLGRLSDEELAIVVEKQTPARAAFIRACAQRLGEAKEQAALDVIAPALDLYWQAELKEVVAAGLRKQAFDPAAAYQQALKLREGTSLSSDDAQAAVLFRQAAEAGHPGAQFYLARLYEKGQGVNKDMAMALSWYRRSASGSCVEAAIALGDLYSDGFSVQRNHLEAFVWYSVAAAHGHKVAAVLRDSLRRRLPTQQVARGETRVAQILAGEESGDNPSGEVR